MRNRSVFFLGLAILAVALAVSCSQSPTVDIRQTGSITGRVLYSNSEDHSGIVLTLDKTDGIRAITSGDGSRAIAAMSTSNADGSFAFNNLEPGIYTVYASSNDSLEKAVSTDVVVEASKTVTIDDLHLTATGSLSGYVTIDGSATGNAGILISIASTSYMATTGDNGYYCITGIPAGSRYSLIAVKGSYMTVIGTFDVEALKVRAVTAKNLSADDIESGNNSLIWKGSYPSASALASPKRNWAYFNTTDGCSYIFDGSEWTLLAARGDKGETGESGTSGTNGVSITWKGELAEAPQNPGLYWAYYDSNDGCSYLFDGTRWALLASKGDKGDQGEQGEPGIQGETGSPGAAGADGRSIIWLGSFSRVPADPDKLDAYYNTTNGCSYIYDGEKWEFLARGGCMGSSLHMFSDEWTFDENFHWHEAICDHKDQRGEFGEHSWDSGTVTVQPTCMSMGVMVYTCVDCGATKELTVASNQHRYELVDTVDATCTEDGLNTYRCSICGDIYTQTILSAGHDFGTDNICDICGFEIPSAHVHSMTEEIVDPTCTSMGYTIHRCTGCDYSYKDDFIEPSSHKWDTGVVTTPKTCTTDGIKTYTCSECGDVSIEIIPAGHSYEYTIITAPTCVSTGLRGAVCTVCGDVIEQEVIPAAHTWNNGVVISEATCTTAGLVRYTCEICGETKEVETPAHGHEFHNGKCKYCGVDFIDSIYADLDFPEYGMYFRIDDIVSAYGPNVINTYGVLLDYNENASIDKVGVYLTQDGTMWRRSIAFVGSEVTSAYYVPFLSYDSDIYYTGMNSNQINTFKLSKNSSGIYTYGNYTTIGVNLADKYGKLLLSLYDVVQAGAKTRVFDNLDEMIAWLTEGNVVCTHDFGDWIVTKDPTCTTLGEKERTCSKCGEIQKEKVAKVDHTFSDWIVTKEATQSQTGIKTRTCSVCGYEESEEVPAIPEFLVGDIGPAGGYIFYDCDADNDTGNADGLISTEVGWRYLEAAPEDLRVVDGVPTVDTTVNGYSSASAGYVFGYYRNSDSGNELFVNGTTTYEAANCTGTAIGTGKTNTRLLVDAMGNEAYLYSYTSSNNSLKTDNYASRLCDILTYTVNGITYDDWFLPSKDELDLMYVNLQEKGQGGFANNSFYWSSSEYYYNANTAWVQYFGSGRQGDSTRSKGCRVLPVRAFMSADDVPVHEHTYSSAWTTDEAYHWHTATCEHADEISGKAEHTFSDWIVTKEATLLQTGIKTRYCSVCGYEEFEEIPVLQGGIGPAGGYIFYDCDADNDTGNADGLISTEVGWRYLEAAPADLRVVDGVPTVDKTVNGYSDASYSYIFGYYRNSDSGNNLFVNGTTTYEAADCTGTAIGTGKTNTRLLVDAMGDEAYTSKSGSDKTANYAARLCDILTYTENGIAYDDWFLPSRDELNQMYVNLHKNGTGGFAVNYDYYWSSSEDGNSTYYAWTQYFSIGNRYYGNRNYDSRVRPVRAFMSADDVPVHEHTYSSAWTTDEAYHWHTATCEHADEISGKSEHSFSDWIVTKEATQSQTGIKTRSCSVCGYEESEEIPAIQIAEFLVGDIGPAGGYIFYDCDADNDTGNADGLISTEVGWRYLEAAPEDLRVVDGVPTVDKTVNGYSYIFGYYRNSDSGNELFVNGTTTYEAANCTGTAIGIGKTNTRLLVDAMGNEAYSDHSGSSKTSNYAARLCDILTYTENGITYDDWFLPSKDELDLMYINLQEKGQGGFADSYCYWSSSEDYYVTYDAWLQDFGNGSQYSIDRIYNFRVRPVRAFMSADDVPVHEHTYSSAWTADETYHWHTATCEHADEISGKSEHSFSDWIVTKEATQSQTGIKTRSCSVCGYEESEEIPVLQEVEYSIGDIGPAGGYIFYDCDADNDTGNVDGLISTEVGWRYLEAAPADLRVVDGVPTVDTTVNGYSSASFYYIFGYYRKTVLGNNLYVNGKTTYEAANCTGTVIGTGKTNTRLLVDAMGSKAYSDSYGSSKTSNYAARLCDILTYTVNGVSYDDWFLPSWYELNQMYVNLHKNGTGGFAYGYYWSSSEDNDSTSHARSKDFLNRVLGISNRYGNSRVRPVRAFMSADDVPVHEHTYSSAWTADETYHWHTATCEHTDEISGKAEHTFSDWIVTREATQSQTGIKTRSCSVCGYEESEEIPAIKIAEFLVGDIGPAGGYIFYDCDADNDTGNADGLISTEVGWRYLEAAPADLKVVDGVPTVDKTVNGYSDASDYYIFGYYRNSDSGNNLFVNGSKIYDVADCTGTALGTGKTNTRLLVDAMGNEAYLDYSGSSKTSSYAARLCDILTYTVKGVTYDDWFLPSRDELNLMFCNLRMSGTGGFDGYYWSSSEYSNSAGDAWEQSFYNGNQYYCTRYYYYDRVRPVRAFMSADDVPVHEHTYSSAWTADETYHWHTATCEHGDEISGKAEHTFSDWIVTKEATQSETGIKTRSCSVCGYEESEEIPVLQPVTYKVGDIGPAGGYIFYDCDADNDTGNADGLISTEVGWRYLEAAPADLRVVDGVPTFDTTGNGYSDASKYYIFGYYRNSDSGSNLFVNGTTTYNEEDCTGKAIGTGKTNTRLLVDAMGNEAYSSNSDSSKTSNYAARLCDILTYTANGVSYDDWFLPSKDELNQMYVNLHKNGTGGFANNYYDFYYWSSSESYSYTGNAWEQYFGNGNQYYYDRSDGYRVRPVRAF